MKWFYIFMASLNLGIAMCYGILALCEIKLGNPFWKEWAFMVCGVCMFVAFVRQGNRDKWIT